MSRALSPEQNEFNDYIQEFDNYSRFDKTDFNSNEKVKELFTIYLEAIYEQRKNIDPNIRRIIYEVEIIENGLKNIFQTEY